MSKYLKGAIVKHQSGEIRGEVVAVFAQGEFPASYHVQWDDGTWSLHAEKELEWVSSDRRAENALSRSAR
ncbi:hypothetical protein M1E08_12750 [Erwinia sp. PK3-005]|uniref:DUF1918 domain-containing protein n=1 Tax=Mixta hanseatica TaxID=2872648 RepID=A0ABY4RDC7_9GAMM|nr:hypothetical protein [Mixta hanseatica]UQY45717.1 hypothetical protein K6958_08735 [Mixta hanseatica]